MGLAEEEDFTKRKKAEEQQSLGESNPYTAEYFRDRAQTTVVVRGMDHFWFDDEDVLADICVAWVQARLADYLEAAREQPLDSDNAVEHQHHHQQPNHQQQRQRHQPNGQKKDDISEESHSRL